jgi:hypothetical protein
MSRKAPIISLNELKLKLKKYLDEDEESDDNFPYNLSETVNKDLSKIQFDFENYFIGNADKSFENYPSDCTTEIYPCGYEVLENGLPVLFVAAGGDWEFPVCFCLYWDGKSIRGYVPEEGNIFNRTTKSAYGNEDDGCDMETLPEVADHSAIRNDVINRIKIR